MPKDLPIDKIYSPFESLTMCVDPDCRSGFSEPATAYCYGLVEACYGASKEAGWWTDLQTGDLLGPDIPKKISLIHSELSEALEGDRKSLMDDKLPHRSMFEVEIADTVIRAADLMGRLDPEYGKTIPTHLAREFADFVRFSKEDIPEIITRLHLKTSLAYAHSDMGTQNIETGQVSDHMVLVTLSQLIAALFAASIALELDIDGAIKEKMAFNAQRADHKIENRKQAGGKSY